MSTEQNHPPEPTAEQCSNGVRVNDLNGHPAYACWYPQMGGYVGKCVITFQPEKGTYDYCFEAFVWHDGTFPFRDEQNPAVIHHCSSEQFIGFGKFVSKAQKEHS